MITLNCDMGEGYGIYEIGDDRGLMPKIDIANVACGFHGSDFDQMQKTVTLAKAHGVKVGAHPSLPDRQGFGRRDMAMGREELRNCLIYQVGALTGFLRAEGMTLNHIKPHGALYDMATRSDDIAESIADVATLFGVPLLGLPNSKHETIYLGRGCDFISEYFADREYANDGRLIVTRTSAEVPIEAAVERCRCAIETGLVAAADGSKIPMRVETICVHSDTPNAVELLAALRLFLSQEMNRC